MSETNDFAKLVLDKYRQICQENDDIRKSNADGIINKESDKFSVSQIKNVSRRPLYHRRKRHANESIGPFKSITETEVGITQYLKKDISFKGIIKHRFSDFQVNEIDKDGKVVELSSLELPMETFTNVEGVKPLSDILSAEQWSKIKEIAEASSDSSEKFSINVTNKTKEERGLIHLAVKNAVESKVITSTKDIGDEKFIEVTKMNKPETRWPSGKPGYLHATMFKVNLDMTEVIHALVDKLRLRANLIGFCGTKDKRAKTCQRISLKKRTAEALASIRLQNVTFGNFEYASTDLRLGDLAGNRFRIAIRNVTDPEEKVHEAMDSLKQNGFINYFGLQRFGFAATPTYVIGKALLSSNWKEAIEYILKPRSNMSKQKELSEALKIWWITREAGEAVKLLNKRDNSIEAKILRVLKKEGNEAYMNALFALPRNTMTLYMHAYQSLIWNRVISRRMEAHGTTVLPGDLVVVSGSVDNLEFDDDSPVDGEKDVEERKEEEDKIDDKDVKQVGAVFTDRNEITDQEENVNNDVEKEETSLPDNICKAKKDIGDENQKKDLKADRLKVKKSNVEVKVLTAEEASKTSIFSVVYPLPGRDIKYPENEAFKWYKEVLAEDGFNQHQFDNKHKHFALGGAYRTIMAHAEDLKWEIVKYSNVNDDLILSDLDKIKAVTLKGIGEGDLRGVTMEFRLKPCHYATMALREVMKCDTSVFAQATLTNEHCDAKKQRTNNS